MHAKQIVASNLLAGRLAKGLTQEQAADLTNAGQDQISRWERGVHTPGLGWQTVLADVYFDGDLTALYREPAAPGEKAAA